MPVVTKYQFTISTETANGKVNGTQLAKEIAKNDAIGVAVDPNKGINTNVEPDKLDIYMADLLTAPQEAALTATVAATQGVSIVVTLEVTIPLVGKEVAVIGDLIWDVLEGAVTTPSFFCEDMNCLFARIIGEHRGDGGQLRLVENVDGEGDEEKIVPFFEFPDTVGAWKRFSVDSNVVPRDGQQNVYRTDARLNGAAALDIRYATISMIKAIVS